MAFRWPWQKAASETEQREERSYDGVPDKVFVGKDGAPNPWPTYEYSTNDPRIHDYIEGLFEGFYGAQNFLTLFECLPEVSAPVHEIASRVASANWQLKKSWNDEVDYGNEQFNRLFSQPNPLMTFEQFVYQAVCYEILTGKQFFYKNQSDLLTIGAFDSVINWWNLQAQSVQVDMRNNADVYAATSLDDLVIRYRQPMNERTRDFRPDRVLPMCNLSLRNSWDINKAQSMLKGADKAIRNLIPVYEARGVIYIKRGALGFLVSRKQDESGMRPFTKSERDQLNKDIDQTYGLTGGKSTIGVTNQPVDFVKTAMSIKELEPFDETLADATAIYARLRVPRHLVPSKDRSTYANADSDLKSFYSDVIIPWAQRLANAWTEFLGLKAERRYIYADYSHVDVLQENRKEKAEVDKDNGATYLQRWLNGACSLNDWIVANGDKKVSNPIYDKKLLEMTPDELEQVAKVIKLKGNGNQDTTPQDSGNEASRSGGELQQSQR